jgi:hypothetical protein
MTRLIIIALVTIAALVAFAPKASHGYDPVVDVPEVTACCELTKP